MSNTSRSGPSPSLSLWAALYLAGGLLLFSIMIAAAISAGRCCAAMSCFSVLSLLFYYAAFRVGSGEFFSMLLSSLCAVMAGLAFAFWPSDYHSAIRTGLIVLLILAALSLVAYIVFQRHSRRPLRLCLWLLGVRGLLLLCLLYPAGSIVAAGYYAIYGSAQSTVFSAEDTAEAPAQSEAESTDETQAPVTVPDAQLSDHLAELAPLADEAQWAALSQQEKLDILRTVMQIERCYLGITADLTLTAEDLPEELQGDYDGKTDSIRIDTAQLEQPWPALRTICHECFHAYELAIVQLYLDAPEQYRPLRPFSYAPDWLKEFTNYVDGSNGTMEEYLSQRVESDARSYANDAFQDYYEKITRYAESHSTS